MDYILGRYVKIARYGSGGLVGGGGKEQYVEDLALWENIIKTAYCFITPSSYTAALETVNIPEKDFSNCFRFLKENFFIIPVSIITLLRIIVTLVTFYIIKVMVLTLFLCKIN